MIKQKFKKSEQLVAYCLKKYPKTRASDRELIMRVWELQGFKIPKKFLHLYYMVHKPGTITRCRRDLQSKGLFRPDEKTRQKRLDYQEKHRDHFKKKTVHFDNKTNTSWEE